MYLVNPCRVILCQRQFNNYVIQLYTLQKCILSALVGLFYAKVSLTIKVSKLYTLQKFMSTLVALFFFLSKSVEQLSQVTQSTKMYHVNPCWVIICQSQLNNYHLKWLRVQKCIFTIILNWYALYYLKKIYWMCKGET